MCHENFHEHKKIFKLKMSVYMVHLHMWLDWEVSIGKVKKEKDLESDWKRVRQREGTQDSLFGDFLMFENNKYLKKKGLNIT